MSDNYKISKTKLKYDAVQKRLKNGVEYAISIFARYSFMFDERRLKFISSTKKGWILTFEDIISKTEFKFSLRNTKNFVLIGNQENEKTILYYFKKSENKCIICIDKYYTDTLPCGHSYCFDCILKTAVHCGKKCPCCRNKFDFNLLYQKNLYIESLESEIKKIKEDYENEIDALLIQLRNTHRTSIPI